MRTFIERHPLVAYFALAFAISWGGLLWTAGGPGGIPVAPERVDALLPGMILSVLAGPSFAGIFLTGLLEGRAGLHAFRSRLFRWRVGTRWYLIALLTAPLLMTGALLTLSLASPSFLPAVVTSDDRASVLGFGLAVGLCAGFFEELGWTGFALPRLRQRYSVAQGGLVLGFLWAAWHLLPAVWLSGAVSGELALASYLLDPFLYLVGFRVLMVWAYDHTGSLPLAMLMHASLTGSARILSPPGLAGPLLTVFDLAWAAAIAVVVVTVVRGTWSTRPGATTPPLRGPGGTVLPDSIAEINWLRLGGVDQWVLIRGENVANPPLILLSGGPGLSETYFFRRFNAPLEKAFTLVYWDQRGTGKSRNRKPASTSLTVERLVGDLDELIDTACGRLDATKVVLFGHSWGSVLGVLYAARFPHKVAAYVGSGQIGDWRAAEAASYAGALARAQHLGHRRALKALTTMGPPPYSADAVWTERTWASRLHGQLTPRTLWEFARAHLSTPELSVLDLFRLMPTFRSTFATMWPEVSRMNLLEAAPSLEMPVFFFLGRKDPWVPPKTSVAYLDALRAPSKTLVWFEESGHEPFVDEPGKFNASMVEIVRPAVVTRRSP